MSPLNGVEGWCIRGPTTIVRLSQNSSEVRRRFTLAHELAHLVLGTDPDIALEPFRSDRLEEREADRLAAECLIPSIRLLYADLSGQKIHWRPSKTTEELEWRTLCTLVSLKVVSVVKI